MVINGAVVAKLHYLNQMSLFVTDQACDVMSRGRAVTDDCPSPVSNNGKWISFSHIICKICDVL